LYLVCVAIINFISNSEIELGRVSVEGMDNNLLASHFLICITYLLFVYFSARYSLKINILIVGLIILFLLGVIATGSRAALLSFLILFLVMSPKRYMRFKTVSQVLVIISAGFIFINSENIFTQLLEQRVAALEVDNGAKRLIIWKVAGSMIKENLILGVGYRNFASEFSNYLRVTPLEYLEELGISKISQAGTHNAVLETISELGIIGFLFFYGFQFHLLKWLKTSKNHISTLLLFILFAINFNSLFGDLANLKYFWLFVSLGFGLKFAYTNSLPPHSKPPRISSQGFS
jgi:O-antigen ligase